MELTIMQEKFKFIQQDDQTLAVLDEYLIGWKRVSYKLGIVSFLL